MIPGATRFFDDVGSPAPQRPSLVARGVSLPWLGLLATGIVFALVVAAPAEAMQLSPQQKLEMKQHYEKATRAYDVQKYTEAVDEYQKAYEIGGDPAMLYNVAQSYRLADQLPEALRFYRRYLQRSPNARNREDVEKKISDLEKTIDERRRAAAAVPVPSTPPPAASTAPPPVAPLVQKDEGSSGMLIAGIVVASVGAAALATAAITGKMASNKADQLTTASMEGQQYDPNVQKNGKTLNTVAVISAIAGGVAAITGVVLIVVSQADSTEKTQASLSPMIGPGLMGAAATLRF